MEKIIITIILINIEITINKHDYSFTLKKKCLLRHQNSTLNITFRKTTSNKLVTSKKVKIMIYINKKIKSN
jgi:hypothetical protein